MVLTKLRDPAWVTDVMQAGPNGKRFDTASLLELSSVPDLVMYDGVDASSLPKGLKYGAGYFNGTFANLAALKAAEPGALIVSITPDGAHGAMYIDIEPGDAVPGDAPGFIKAGGLGFYCSASQVSVCVSACTSAGIGRSSYKVWSAHWIGAHICMPTVCGYPQADATQWLSTAGWDESWVAALAFFGPQAVPPVPWPLQQGNSGPAVVTLQKNLNRWKIGMPPLVPLVADGNFGLLTKAAVQNALAHWNYSAAKVAAGVVDEDLWNDLTAPVSPVAVPPSAPKTITGVTIDYSDGSSARWT